MAPSHLETGAMVYLANVEPRRVQRGTVGIIQAARSRQTSPNAASEYSPETAFLHGTHLRPSGTAHLKSFPSEKMKRGHYV